MQGEMMHIPAFTKAKGLAVTSMAIVATILGVGAGGTSQARSLHSSSSNMANGVYLYGQVAQPNQISKGYVVFQQHNGEVVGAFYYPRSEFQCFRGALNSTRLDVQPVTTENAVSDETTAELSNLHRITKISADDRRILSVCRQTVAAATTPQAVQ